MKIMFFLKKSIKKFFILLLIINLKGCQLTNTNGVFLNDLHSGLNKTKVMKVVQPKNEKEVMKWVEIAKKQNLSISISGKKHSMGGQQFGENTLHLNMTQMNNVLSFDKQSGVISVESGICWDQLISYVLENQNPIKWGITQKQTGADDITLGGSLSVNAHGRGLSFSPLIQDIVSFKIVNESGKLLNVSRTENSELFNLVIGGYGLFGVITSIDLKLSERKQLKRNVKVLRVNELYYQFEKSIKEGHLYGDYQFNFDDLSVDFLNIGIFSTYSPFNNKKKAHIVQKKLDKSLWDKLLVLAVSDKGKAYELYKDYYLSTDGQHYQSDTHQLSIYDPDYMQVIKNKLPKYENHSLMISELYVPLDLLESFMMEAKYLADQKDMNIVYGTIRLIKQDNESFLAWAKQDYACIIFNLMVEHSELGVTRAKKQFRSLIDLALKRDGSFFLTYHRWATKKQLLKAYPQFIDFLKIKRKYDPQERFQSDWYRYYKKMFDKELSNFL